MLATTSNRQLGCRRLNTLMSPYASVSDAGSSQTTTTTRCAASLNVMTPSLKTGSRVDEQHVERLEQLAEGADEAGMLDAAQASPC